MLQLQDQLIGELLAELAPLPYTPFPVSRAGRAFRKKMSGRHIGKIVPTFS